jgi:hypothetical protein
MSGRGSFTWSDEQRHALERRVLDEHVSMAQAHREAHAGELRSELGGPKLPPFAIPITTVHHIVRVERERRHDLHLEAASIDDPALAHRELSRLLLASLRMEVNRMGAAMKTGSRRKNTAWDELTQASRALEAAGKAIGIGKATTVQEPSTNGKTEPEEAPSLVARLAKDNGRETVQRPHAATQDQDGESPALGPGLPEASEPEDQSASAVR